MQKERQLAIMIKRTKKIKLSPKVRLIQCVNIGHHLSAGSFDIFSFFFRKTNFHKQFSCRSKIDEHKSILYLSETVNIHRFDGTEIISSQWNNSFNMKCVSEQRIEVSVSLGRTHLLYSTIYHTKRNIFRFSVHLLFISESDAK